MDDTGMSCIAYFWKIFCIIFSYRYCHVLYTECNLCSRSIYGDGYVPEAKSKKIDADSKRSEKYYLSMSQLFFRISRKSLSITFSNNGFQRFLHWYDFFRLVVVCIDYMISKYISITIYSNDWAKSYGGYVYRTYLGVGCC